jgi:hypothetical protein
MAAQDAANLCNGNGGIDPFKDDEIDELKNEKEQDSSFYEPPCTRGEILHSDIAVFSAAK